jgi:hypothetical protein
MTENEKLRALLAEAREVVQGVLRAADSTPYAQWSRDQHQAEIVRDAIDAALAEPVVDYQRERDEAQAEVKRLRKLMGRFEKLNWVDHPEGVDATAFDVKTGNGVTIAPEYRGFRWYIKSPGIPVVSSAWFETMEEAKKSAEAMIEAFQRGG